ncbi:MAG: hypothetical protein AAFP22_14700, partial [Planctomycetota bacterium]
VGPVCGLAGAREIDLGDLELEEPARIRFQLVLDGAGRLDGHTVRCVSPVAFEAVTDELGIAEAPPLPPGDQFVEVQLGPGARLDRERAPARYYVRLDRGGDRKVDLGIPVLSAAEISVQVRLNGQRATDAYLWFYAVEPGGDRRPIERVAIGDDGLARCSVPADVPIQLELAKGWGETPLEQTWTFDPGAHVIELDVVTCRLDVELPSRLSLGDESSAYLRWRWPGGEHGEVRADEIDRHGPRKERTTARFSAVPAGVTELRLVVEEGDPYETTTTLLDEALDCVLEAEGRVSLRVP